MEVKINKEIRDYSESMFFGLTLRQFFFSVLGCAAAVGIYFLARQPLGLEVTTWLCVIGVVPFAAIGFIKYNGMTAEQFAWAYLKSRFICPCRYLSLPRSVYYDVLEESIAQKQGSLTRKELKKIRKKDKKNEKAEAKAEKKETGKGRRRK